MPFNEAALPGFNAIKDFDVYDERTRHTNADFPERMSEDELKQSAIVMATFAWQAAMRPSKIPRAGGLDLVRALAVRLAVATFPGQGSRHRRPG